MRFEAEHVQLQLRERVQIDCPPRTAELYKKIAQVAALLTLGPIGLVLFTCILHIPVLPLIGLVALLWAVRALEVPMTRWTTRLLWPAHRWWLVHTGTIALPRHIERAIEVSRRPAVIDVDADRGRLSVGDDTLDLSSTHAVEVERADDHGPQLRLRLFQTGHTPVVVGAALSHDALGGEVGELYTSLPRKEGEVILMPWEDFRRFIDEVRLIHEASGQRLPRILRKLSAPS